MKTFGFVCLAVVGFFVLWGLGILFGIFSLPFHTASNIVNTEHGVIDKTINADNAIYNYEWFKEKAEKIKAYEIQIKQAHTAVVDFEASAGDRKNWDFQDKQEDSRLRSIELGLRQQLENSIAEYNARSKEANRNIFKNGLFPASFEVGSNILGGQN